MKSPRQLLNLLTGEQVRQKQVFVESSPETIQYDEAIPVLEEILATTTDDLALMKACDLPWGTSAIRRPPTP